MIKKKICILTAAPEEPTNHHRNVFCNNDLCDYYFVTYNKKNKDALGFFYTNPVYDNRNELARLVPKEYDYYAFIDDDSVFKSVTKNSIIEQLVIDLNKCNPAVMITYCPDQGNPPHNDLNPGKYNCGCFSVNMVKIVHHSLIPFFFPVETSFGGYWDSCSFFNILESVAFEKYCVVTPFVRCRTLRSSAYSQNRSPQLGWKAMEDNYQWIKPAIKNKDLHFDNVNLFKKYFIDKRRYLDIEFSNNDVNYFDLNYFDTIFDLSHPYFKRKTK